ncbi:hypothetical protein T265_02587 [Opisthorchis viverrini]|uniref:Uncharacterized protein n=1 Tax=Opisthorchis viverrini TaxID=6198 RepID=A0A074ZYT8_OPIVI|nr:hypothetical protein T265_02587 [Opisthorchis viverrini]KER31142.1 hypothetical protein T265_02587 [Opisthorchis viverrini]
MGDSLSRRRQSCPRGSPISYVLDLRTPFGCWSVRRAWQLDCKRFITNGGDIVGAGLTMSPRLVMKRLQSNCQARRTDQQPNGVRRSSTYDIGLP